MNRRKLLILSLGMILVFLFASAKSTFAENSISMGDVWNLRVVVVDADNLREEAGLGEGCGFLWMGCLWDATFGAVGDSINNIIPAALFAMITYFWLVYKLIAYFLIEAIAWAFSLEIIDMMYDALKNTLLDFQENLWNPFMYFMWAVALAWMVYYWISGKNTKLWSTLISTLLIIAISATVFTRLPDFLRIVSGASACVSETILVGFANGRNEEGGTVASSCTINHISGTGDVSQPPEPQGATEDLKQSLIKLFILKPWQLINFGSYEFAEGDAMGDTNWKQVMNYKPDPEREGEDHPVYIGVKNETEDKEENERQKILDKYNIFTLGKIMDRLSYASTSIITSLIALALFFVVSILCIIWQFIALGRAVLAAVYLLLALWPGYGAKEAAMWGWSMVQALFMKVFYTICLATFVVLSGRLTEMSTSYSIREVPYFGDILGFLVHWMMMIGMFIGLWFAMKEMRQKLENIPLGNGMFLQGATGEAEGVLKKGAKIGVGVGAVAATVASGGTAAPALGAVLSGKGGALKAATSALASGGGKPTNLAGKGMAMTGKGLKFAGKVAAGAPLLWTAKAGVWAGKVGWAASKNLAKPKLKKGNHQGVTGSKKEPKLKKAVQFGKDSLQVAGYLKENLQSVEGQQKILKGISSNRKKGKEEPVISQSPQKVRLQEQVDIIQDQFVNISKNVNQTISMKRNLGGHVSIQKSQAIDIMKSVQQFSGVSDQAISNRLGGMNLDLAAGHNPDRVVKEAHRFMNETVVQMKEENANLYGKIKKEHQKLNRNFQQILQKQ